LNSGVLSNQNDWKIKMGILKELAFQIINGVIPLTPVELAIERIKVCEACEFFGCTARQCKVCWCFIDAKARILESECPAGKW
jgi:hypothetical protein